MELDPQYGRQQTKKHARKCMCLICQPCTLLFKGFEHQYKVSLGNSVRFCFKIKSHRYWGDNSAGQCFACCAQVLMLATASKELMWGSVERVNCRCLCALSGTVCEGPLIAPGRQRPESQEMEAKLGYVARQFQRNRKYKNQNKQQQKKNSWKCNSTLRARCGRAGMCWCLVLVTFPL